jgi:hypothetical protein
VRPAHVRCAYFPIWFFKLHAAYVDCHIHSLGPLPPGLWIVSCGTLHMYQPAHGFFSVPRGQSVARASRRSLWACSRTWIYPRTSWRRSARCGNKTVQHGSHSLQTITTMREIAYAQLFILLYFLFFIFTIFDKISISYVPHLQQAVNLLIE